MSSLILLENGNVNHRKGGRPLEAAVTRGSETEVEVSGLRETTLQEKEQ